MSRRKWTLELAREAFAKNGKTLLANEYVNPRTKMPYICQRHESEGVQYMTLDKCLRGQGCRLCKLEKISAKNRTSLEAILSKCEELGLTYISHCVVNNKTKVTYICPKHPNKGEHTVEWSSLNSGHGCPYCATELTTSKLRTSLAVIKEKCEELGLVYISQYIYRDRNHNQTVVEFICPKHKEHGVQTKPWQRLKDGKGCVYCSNEKLSIEQRRSFAFIKEKFESLGLELLSTEDDYYSAKTYDVKLKYRCSKHPNIVQFKSIGSLMQNCGCPLCLTSKGEEEVARVLDGFGVDYTRQYTFSDCKYKHVLPFDFYIDSMNIAIEYDGQQHYEAIEFSGSTEVAQENFRQTQCRDAIKTQYCKDNNIKLIRIPYWDKDKIEEILKKELNIY